MDRSYCHIILETLDDSNIITWQHQSWTIFCSEQKRHIRICVHKCEKLWFFTDKVFHKTFSKLSLFSDHYFNHFDHCYHYHYQCHYYHHYHHHGHYHYGHSYHYYHHCYHYNDYHQFYHHYHGYHCQHYYYYCYHC